MPISASAIKIIKKGKGPFYKLPYRPRWVSTVRKGTIFLYKRKEFASPMVYGNRLYVGSGVKTFYAMETKWGRQKWHFRTEGGISSDPAFLGPAVFVGDDKGKVYSLNMESGKEIWRADFGSEVLVSPTVVDGRLYVSTLEGRLAALNAENGKILWSTEHPLPSRMTIRGHSQPVYHDGLLYVGYADGVLSVHDAKTGYIKKELPVAKGNEHFSDVDMKPLIDGERLYVATFDGDLVSISLKSGETVWRKPIGSGVNLLIDGDRLFVSGSDRSVYALDKKTGLEFWKHEVEKGMPSAPVIWKNVLIVGVTSNNALFLNALNGDVICRRYAKKGIFGTPLIDGDNLYYLSNGGRLYALKMIWSP